MAYSERQIEIYRERETEEGGQNENPIASQVGDFTIHAKQSFSSNIIKSVNYKVTALGEKNKKEKKKKIAQTMMIRYCVVKIN